MVVKPSKNNVGHDHLSRLQSREIEIGIDDEILDGHLFRVEGVENQFIDIYIHLMTRRALVAFTIA